MTARKVWSGGAWVTLGGTGGSGPPMLAPEDISGLVFHIDAITSLGAAASSITTWAELVSGNSPTQGTSGARPVVTTSYFGGQKAALFDGSDDRLVAPAVATTVTDNFMIGIVARPLASTANRCPLFNGVGSTNGWGVATRDPSGYIGLLRGGIAWGNSTCAGAETEQIVIVRRTAGVWSVRVNGCGAASVPPVAISLSSAPSAPASGVSVGSSYSADPWNGALGAGVIYNAAVSDVDCAALEAYWAHRYNVKVAAAF